MLAACVSSGSAPAQRDLPPAPSFAKTIIVADPREGEPAVLVAARERAGRVAANRVITAFRDWYGDVRRDYAGEKP